MGKSSFSNIVLIQKCITEISFFPICRNIYRDIVFLFYKKKEIPPPNWQKKSLSFSNALYFCQLFSYIYIYLCIIIIFLKFSSLVLIVLHLQSTITNILLHYIAFAFGHFSFHFHSHPIYKNQTFLLFTRI